MNHKEKVEFGDWVRKNREGKGLNQTELAALIGVSAGSISAIESGKARSIGRKMVSKLQDFFAGKVASALNHSHYTSIHLPDGLQIKNMPGEELITAVIRKVSSIAVRDDFNDRVAKIADALNCSNEEAAFAIFSTEINKNNS